jgi:hypothetical protein
MKTRHYASEGRLKPGDKKTAADGPPETRLTGNPLPTLPLTARQVAQKKILPLGADLASRAMSAHDVAACFIDTFLGLVAAALLIAVLG